MAGVGAADVRALEVDEVPVRVELDAVSDNASVAGDDTSRGVLDDERLTSRLDDGVLVDVVRDQLGSDIGLQPRAPDDEPGTGVGVGPHLAEREPSMEVGDIRLLRRAGADHGRGGELTGDIDRVAAVEGLVLVW